MILNPYEPSISNLDLDTFVVELMLIVQSLYGMDGFLLPNMVLTILIIKNKLLRS